MIYLLWYLHDVLNLSSSTKSFLCSLNKNGKPRSSNLGAKKIRTVPIRWFPLFSTY